MKEPNLSLGEWFRILPLDISRCLVPLSIFYIIYPFCTFGGRGGVRHQLLCICWWQIIVFTKVYPELETWWLLPTWGSYHLLLRGTNDLTCLMGRETIANMSHQVLSSSSSMFLGGSMSIRKGRGYDGVRKEYDRRSRVRRTTWRWW